MRVAYITRAHAEAKATTGVSAERLAMAGWGGGGCPIPEASGPGCPEGDAHLPSQPVTEMGQEGEVMPGFSQLPRPLHPPQGVRGRGLRSLNQGGCWPVTRLQGPWQLSRPGLSCVLFVCCSGAGRGGRCRRKLGRKEGGREATARLHPKAPPAPQAPQQPAQVRALRRGASEGREAGRARRESAGAAQGGGGRGKEPWPLGAAHPHVRGPGSSGAPPSCAPQGQSCSHYPKQTV